ncbi:MAG: hypothetical protein SGPRY_004970 [Prymnesium sp.]
MSGVTPALGKSEAELRSRFSPHGVGSRAHAEIRSRLLRFVRSRPPTSGEGRVGSLLLVPEGGGAGGSALAAWAAAQVGRVSRQ